MEQHSAAYNYRAFDATSYDLVDTQGPRVGDPMPDFVLSTLDGEPVRLSDFRGKIMVLETGSITCPIYSGRIPGMNELAAEFPDVEFLVLYVREAHPGRNIPAHATQADKLARAQQLLTVQPEHRRILVDDVAGTAHRVLGGLPDLVYIVGPDGEILFRADWNDVPAVRQALRCITANEPVGQVDPHFRPPPPWVTLPVLVRSGGDALRDFLWSLPNLIYQHARAFTCKKFHVAC